MAAQMEGEGSDFLLGLRSTSIQDNFTPFAVHCPGRPGHFLGTVVEADNVTLISAYAKQFANQLHCHSTIHN